MKSLRFLVLTLCSLLLLAGSALADYQPEHDISVNVELAPELIQTDGSTGESSFAAQEGAHSTLTQSTGQSVSHYYIWIYLNGKPVLAVDPIRCYSY